MKVFPFSFPCLYFEENMLREGGANEERGRNPPAEGAVPAAQSAEELDNPEEIQEHHPD